VRPDLPGAQIMDYIKKNLCKAGIKPDSQPSNCKPYNEFVSYRNDYSPIRGDKKYALDDDMSSAYAKIIAEFDKKVSLVDADYNPYWYILTHFDSIIDLRVLVQKEWEVAVKAESSKIELWEKLDNELEQLQALTGEKIIDLRKNFKDNYVSVTSSSSSKQDYKKTE
jgi:hypothetical protein